MNHFQDIFYESKLNAFLAYFICLYYGMQCFAFSISGGGSEASYKRDRKNVSDDDNAFYKTSAITGDFVLR